MTSLNAITVAGKQTKIGKSLSIYVKESLETTLKKFFKNFINSSVLFSKDTFNFKCEISIHLEGSIFVKSNALSNDPYGSFNLANEKIKKRIRRYHRKLTDHRFNNTKSLKYVKANEYIIKDPETIKSGEVANEPIIIAESEELIKTISVGEALMLMKLNDQNAIFFKNVQTKRLNLLFKRSDGNIGWLDPKK